MMLNAAKMFPESFCCSTDVYYKLNNRIRMMGK